MGLDRSILDTAENGFLIIKENDFKVVFWNRWLAIQTKITKETAQGTALDCLFPDTSFRLLKRKIRIASKINTSTFINSSVDKYLIPIPLNRITTSMFKHMRQDCVITWLNDDEVSLIIYDSSSLLEARAVIKEQLSVVERQATIDYLTQCYNKGMFNKLLSGEIKRTNRHNNVFSLIIFDIDNFKIVNDTFGHLAGDTVLQEIARITRGAIRESDNFARWGGEEFCILLPDTNIQGGKNLADKLQRTIANHDFGNPGTITCSFGVVQFSPELTEDKLVSRADKALYRAKQNGKNQAVVYNNEKLSLEV